MYAQKQFGFMAVAPGFKALEARRWPVFYYTTVWDKRRVVYDDLSSLVPEAPFFSSFFDLHV